MRVMLSNFVNFISQMVTILFVKNSRFVCYENFKIELMKGNT